MRARVYVSLKPSVLDPQGKTIQHVLASLGHGAVADVRQGKFFEIELSGVTDPAGAKGEIEQIAREVLANPVTEEFRVELL